MTQTYDVKLIAQELRNVSPDVAVTSAFSRKREGIQPFLFWTTRLVTTDEMISICRDMAAVIRRSMPERPDGWAAAILASNAPMVIMGTYYLGWAGHADEWRLVEGQERTATDGANWLALCEGLRALLTSLGMTEGKDEYDGDFYMSDIEEARRIQAVFIRQPEFLTTELIAGIQKLLADGHTRWVVSVVPVFGEQFRVLEDGFDVRADRFVERWDRQEAERLLGDRLKI